MRFMRVTSKGRVTIPKAIRDRFALVAGTEVDFVVTGNVIRLVKAGALSRGEALVLRLRGACRGGMTTDEVLAMTRDL